MIGNSLFGKAVEEGLGMKADSGKATKHNLKRQQPTIEERNVSSGASNCTKRNSFRSAIAQPCSRSFLPLSNWAWTLSYCNGICGIGSELCPVNLVHETHSRPCSGQQKVYVFKASANDEGKCFLKGARRGWIN